MQHSGARFGYDCQEWIMIEVIQRVRKKSGNMYSSVMKYMVLIFLNWDSLHARLNSHYKAWGYKKMKHKKMKPYRKSHQKEPTVNRYLLILDLMPTRLQVKEKHSRYRPRIPESSCAKKETVNIDILVTSWNGD